MKSKMNIFVIIIITCLILLTGPSYKIEASNSLSLIVNGKDMTKGAMPIIENDRTLVPIRFVSEELGAKVTWNNANKTVLIENKNNSILLKINNRLINYNDGKDYTLSDVEPKLLNKDGVGNSKTYVPLRLVSDALDIGVEWNEKERKVSIDSQKPVEKFTNSVQIISQDKNELISGETTLQVEILKNYPAESHIKFILIDKGHTSGFILAKGSNIDKKYIYNPKIEDNGKKILVASIYDKNGKYIDGHAIPIEVKVKPTVELLGVSDSKMIESKVELSVNTNFMPMYVKYEMTNIVSSNTENTKLTSVKDPLSPFTWNPTMKENGLYSIRAIAYDAKDNPYYSQPVLVEVDIKRLLTLSGVKENMIIDKSVTLSTNRNFDVSETSYMIKDVKTGTINTIINIPYGSYKWNPGPDQSGVKEIFVRVIDRGITYDSDHIRVTVEGKPKILLEGIAPKQVINKETILNYESNVDVDQIKYIITSSATNKNRQIIPQFENSEVIYNPLENEKGDMTVEVEGDYKGQKISSEKIRFKVYHGDYFSPVPVVEKDKFIPLASKLAIESYEEIGMSAALQTAQAILETGWGQSVPVDKYTGVKSNNLFGIKGKATMGSVISNTWEVYNGETYRVDAEFRAYKDLNESWKDHKKFLLNSERYKDFKEVMFDYTRGAWALKRSGYATDPDYPIKLINIIKNYKLGELDKIKI